MHIVDVLLNDVKLIASPVFHDNRGFFKEAYRRSAYKQVGIECEFVQDNHSFSKKGTLRGMHFQRFPGQAKLVSVIVGKIYDVVVDIRPTSPTFKQWKGVYLDDETHRQLFVPVGFAHGICVVSQEAHILYKVSNDYDPKEEKGFRFDDPEIGIKWPEFDYHLSMRDKEAPFFGEVIS